MPRRRSFWFVPPREARVHAVIVGVVLWIVAVVSLAYPGPRGMFNTLKGGDFVHFYTLGDVTHEALRGGTGDVLYDAEALHARQVALVPSSATDRYVPIYPPHTGLIFAVFALLPYGLAFVAWTVFVTVIYACCVGQSWRAVGPARLDGWSVAITAAAFPPFWNLILHGQTSVVPLLAFTGAALCFARGHRFLAGLFLGLLAVKPQFALCAALVFVLAREGRMIAGALAAGALQVVAAMAVFGPRIWQEYFRVVLAVSGQIELLEPRPYQLHSIAVLARLLPAPVDLLIWIVSAVAVIWISWRVWSTSLPPLFKFGVIVLASVLVNPHLTVYDAVVLFPAALWVGTWISAFGTERLQERFWTIAYWTFASLLAPSAWLIWVQASVVLMLILFATVCRAALLPRATDGPGR